ncbi:MAG TPA: nitronate monooxygenase [Steroidobacteraceae bacterium]|nr:nitronate monooxygenase [Steroidobacteraceae bacterium]
MSTLALRTAACEALGARYPIVQTAMGYVATPELVAASCNAGAFGILACATLAAPEVAPAIDRVRALTDRPFGVNFHMFQPGAAQIVDTILEKRVRVVSFGRGPDAAMIARFRAAGLICIASVGALRHAQKSADLGADMLIVQGGEGGGHTGSVATTVLLPQVLDAVKIPVFAAGGFADGRGLAAALACGAAGVAMGTRFLMTRESPVPDATKARYVKAGLDDVFVTTRLDGIPHRMLRNELAARIERSSGAGVLVTALRNAFELKRLTGASLSEMLRSARAMARSGEMSLGQALLAANSPVLLQRAVVQGHPAEGIMASGQVAGRLGDLPSCAELIERIVREAEARLETACALLPRE